jgi:hypothetical protein
MLKQLLVLRQTEAEAAAENDEEQEGLSERCYSVRQLCITLGVNRTWYYERQKLRAEREGEEMEILLNFTTTRQPHLISIKLQFLSSARFALFRVEFELN